MTERASIIATNDTSIVLHGSALAQLDVLDEYMREAPLGERPDGTVGDLMCIDPPFSDRTHKGHDAGPNADGVDRAELPYASWRAVDVERFVDAWAPRVRGWWNVLTDHVLGRAWERELEAAGLYVFAPLPVLVPGQTVRRRGDGPSSCTTQLFVARPRNAEFAAWGTMPSHYIQPRGAPFDAECTGGKSTAIMMAIIGDYSRRGDIVLDPVCGMGTAGAAARSLGRRTICGDVNRARAEHAARRIRATREQYALPLGAGPTSAPVQQALGALMSEGG